MKETVLKSEIFTFFEDDQNLARLFILVKNKANTLHTLKRWFANNDVKLTLYDILLAISEITGKTIEEITERK